MKNPAVKFKVTPFQGLVLLQNALTCGDASNDADRTADELIQELNKVHHNMNQHILESALYCCNMNAEDSKFLHPHGTDLDKFLNRLIPPGYKYDKGYNLIVRDIGP